MKKLLLALLVVLVVVLAAGDASACRHRHASHQRHHHGRAIQIQSAPAAGVKKVGLIECPNGVCNRTSQLVPSIFPPR